MNFTTITVPTLADYYSRQVQPRFEYGSAYIAYLLPKMASGLAWAGEEGIRAARNFGRMATPIVRNTARTWRRTVDETIAPGVVSGLSVMGKSAMTGLTAGADVLAGAVMGEDSKDETKAALSTLSRALFFNATEGRRSYGAGTAASDSLIPPPPPTEAHFPYVPSQIYHRNSRLQEPFRGISREGYYTDSGDTIDSLPVYSVEPRSDITDPYYINSVYPSASTNNHRVIIGTILISNLMHLHLIFKNVASQKKFQ